MNKLTYENAFGQQLIFLKTGNKILKSIDANSIGTTAIAFTPLFSDRQITQKVTYNPRTIRCEFYFKAITNGKFDYQLARQRWQDIVNILILHKEGTLTYYTDNGDFKINCRPIELSEPTKIVGSYYSFKVDFLADYPFWKNKTAIVQNAENGELYYNNITGLEIPFILQATVPASQLFTFINETASGAETIKFSSPQQQEVTFKVDTEKCEVYVKNNYGIWVRNNFLFTINSKFDMKLKPGDNEMTTTASDTKITFNKLYLGV